MMPPGSMPGSMMPGGQAGSPGVTKPVEISVGWSFASESTASQVEATLLDVIKAIQAALQKQNTPPGGGMMPPGGMPPGGMPPGGMPPGGMPPGGMPPGGMPRGGGAPNNDPRRQRFMGYLQVAPGGQPGAPGGPPGGMPPGGMPGGLMPPGGMSGSQGGADNDPNVTLVHITRDKANVKLRYNVTLDDTATVGKLIAKAIEASGASALNDGLYDGTLTLLSAAMHKWEE